MDGDFKGDFTRDTFSSLNHYSRVLMQQGRVQLDADWNEQIDILLYYLRTLTRDLVGPRAVRGDGFLVAPYVSAQAATATRARTRGARASRAAATTSTPDLSVARGHYYVDGILVENDGDSSYTFDDSQRQSTSSTFLVYLDVWERQVTYIENRYIREVALGTLGPDTATRGMVVWQVRVTNNMPDGNGGSVAIQSPPPSDFVQTIDSNWQAADPSQSWVSMLESPHRGSLKARGSEASKQDTTPCIISPESRYRGAENQLYRVEIHNGGSVDDTKQPASFKWSRENGSVIFPISNLAGKVVTLDTLGHDKRFGLKPDAWVEIVDDDYVLQDSPNPLLQIDTIDTVNMRVTLKDAPATAVGQDQTKYPFLRRWDQNAGEHIDGSEVTLTEGAIKIQESSDEPTGWITLEDNVQIQFQAPAAEAPANTYHSGDYWLIPARTITGDVEWPSDNQGNLIAQRPHGVEHHYAPLALISLQNGKVDPKGAGVCDLRRKLIKLWNGPTGCPS
jgi:Family of unknown function (DUF6519)